jgi:serine protease Do
MKQPKGALVAQVLKGSPAGDAGVEVGDIIVEYEGKDVYDSSDLPPMVGRTRIGDKAKVTIVRNGKNKTLYVKIGELPTEGEMEIAPEEKHEEKPLEQLGMVVDEIMDEQRELFKVDKGGVLVKEIIQNPARAAGIERGDVITRLNNKVVSGIKGFNDIVDKLPKGRSIPVLVIRQGSPRFLALKIDG